MRRTFRPPWWRVWSRLSEQDRRLLGRIIGLGVGAFLFGYLITALVFFGGSGRPEVASVPDLRELTQRQAERALEREGLELAVSDTLPHPEIRAGAVLTQTPLPGREVVPGSEVRVILSTGRPLRVVPDVTALGRVQAERVLSAAGFRVEVVEAPAPRAAGQVLAIDPAPGTRVPTPAPVRLTVSAGPPMVAVPQVVGLGLENARAALEGAGLRLGEVEWEPVGLDQPEVVLIQTPAPGDSARMGTRVTVRAAAHRLPNESL